VDLPSFIWLWRIAAWSMGLSLSAYLALAVLGGWIAIARRSDRSAPGWVRWLHILVGVVLVSLVLLLLSIGIIGTLGEYGHLGHSWHLPAGLLVVTLVLASAGSASQIAANRPWARSLHLTINGILFFALAAVSWSGWVVVQKYLP
jgi:ABC-type amino acid transport system permease subunit